MLQDLRGMEFYKSQEKFSLFGGSAESNYVGPDFGAYVTLENVDDFCNKTVRNWEAYDPDHGQWIPNAEEWEVMTRRINYSW